MLVSFLVHLSVGLVITYTGLVEYFGPDALAYDEKAAQVLANWRGDGIEADLAKGKEGFFYLLAGLYSIFGRHLFIGLMANAGFAAALIPVTALATRRLFGEAEARWAPFLVTITPAFLIWPSQLLREAPILLLLAAAGTAAVILTERLHLLPAAVLVASLLLLYSFRSTVALVVSAPLMVGVALGFRSRQSATEEKSSPVALIGVVTLASLLVVVGVRVAGEFELSDLQRFRSMTRLEAGSAIEDGDVGTVDGLLRTLPAGILRVLVGPFPWEVEPRQVLGLLDAIAMWGLIACLWIGTRRGWHQAGARLLPLLLPAGALLVVLAVTVGNYGLLLRERTQMLVLLTPLFALGIETVARPAVAAGPESSSLTPTIKQG